MRLLDRSIPPRLLGLATLLAIVLTLLFTPRPAHSQAAEAATGTARNVYLAGGQVRIVTPVAGDLTAAGGRIVVEQAVGRDATLAAGSLEVRAPVGEDLRAAAGNIELQAPVGGELHAAAGNVTIGRGASVADEARVYAGDFTLQGRLDRDLAARARRIVIDGEIKGNASLAAEQIELGPQARIGGSLDYAAAGEIKRAPEAVVTGNVRRSAQLAEGPQRRGPGRHAGDSPGGSWARVSVFFVGMVATAALLLLVAPAWTRSSAQRLQQSPWASLGVGVLVLVVLPLLCLLLVITILGIPVAMAGMMLYPVLMLGGLVITAFALAGLLAVALRRQWPTSYGASIALAALALLLLVLASRTPWVGWLAIAVAIPFGLGAALLETRARWRRGAPHEGTRTA